MKKILFTIALIITLSLTASAQYSDGFFNDWDNGLDRTGIGMKSASSSQPTTALARTPHQPHSAQVFWCSPH